MDQIVSHMNGLKADLSNFVDESLECFDNKTVEENWSCFKHNLSSLMDTYIPSKLSSTRFNAPWFNRTLHKMRRKQQRLYNKAKQSDNERMWSKYREFKKEYNKALRQAHNNHLTDIFSSDSDDNKKAFFKYIKDLRRDRCGISPLKSEDKIVSDSQGKANVLSEYFSSVFTKEPTEDIPLPSGDSLPSIPPLEFSRDGIVKLLQDLNPNKASGPDNIPVRILKECAEQIAPFLQAMFTQSFETGNIPSDWKMAFITPLFKKGDRSLPSHHRPVSLTSVCSKLMEHIVFKHIMTHCEHFDRLTEVQHGFRRQRSCESQLLETVDDLAFHIDQGNQVDVVVLDFRKAFDTVPHQRLLSKLDHVGIRGSTFKWVEAFLTNRKQKVVVDGKESSAQDVVSGVPQGTVMGPLLFLLYINDLPQSIKSQVRLFADDALIYHVIHNRSDQESLQADLQHLETWQRKWLSNAIQSNKMHCSPNDQLQTQA